MASLRISFNVLNLSIPTRARSIRPLQSCSVEGKHLFPSSMFAFRYLPCELDSRVVIASKSTLKQRARFILILADNAFIANGKLLTTVSQQSIFSKYYNRVAS